MADFVLGYPYDCYYNPDPYTTFRVRIGDLDAIEVAEWFSAGNYLFCLDDADHENNRLQLASDPTVNLEDGYIEFVTTSAPAGSLPNWANAAVAPILGAAEPTTGSDLSTMIGLVDNYNVDNDIIWAYRAQATYPAIFNDPIVDPCRVVGMLPSCAAGCRYLQLNNENFVGTTTIRNLHIIPDVEILNTDYHIAPAAADNTGSYDVERCMLEGGRVGLGIQTAQDDDHDGTITIINNIIYGGLYCGLLITAIAATSFETIECHHNAIYYTSPTWTPNAMRVYNYLSPSRIHCHNNLVVGAGIINEGTQMPDFDGNASWNAPAGAANHVNLTAYTNKQIGLNLNRRLTNKIYEDSVLAGAGQAEALVGIDINGRARDASTPTIGPWEEQYRIGLMRGFSHV